MSTHQQLFEQTHKVNNIYVCMDSIYNDNSDRGCGGGPNGATFNIKCPVSTPHYQTIQTCKQCFTMYNIKRRCLLRLSNLNLLGNRTQMSSDIGTLVCKDGWEILRILAKMHPNFRWYEVHSLSIKYCTLYSKHCQTLVTCLTVIGTYRVIKRIGPELLHF